MTTTLIISAVAAAVASVLLTPVIALVARAARVMDMPGLRKVHQTAVPRLGGAVIATAFIGVLAAAALIEPAVGGKLLAGPRNHIFAMAIASLAVFFIGLMDDIRGLGAMVKLAGQLAAALAVCICGIRIETLPITTGLTLHLGALSWPVTIMWLLLITNAVNLIDGLDGLAGGICSIASAALAVFALCTGQIVLALLMLALLGCLLGFLVFNAHPARIFLGDCGSMFLGFLLAAASACSTADTGDVRAVTIAGLSLSVPILDSLFSVMRRLLQRHPVFSPDRGHIHHRLLASGSGHVQVVMRILAVTLAVTAVAMLTIFTRADTVWLIVLLDLALLLAGLGFVVRLNLVEAVRSLGQNIAMARKVHEYTRIYEESLQRLRESASFEQWWRAVCLAADQMGLKQISLDLHDRTGLLRQAFWARDGNIICRGMLRLSISVRHRRSGPPLKLAIEIPITGLTEFVGIQASIFGRLVDEFSLADLPILAAGTQLPNARSGAA